MPVEMVLEDFAEAWGVVLPAYQVHASLVLLDAKTGYRSQKHVASGVVQL